MPYSVIFYTINYFFDSFGWIHALRFLQILLLLFACFGFEILCIICVIMCGFYNDMTLKSEKL